jgi:hypothetical protein
MSPDKKRVVALLFAVLLLSALPGRASADDSLSLCSGVTVGNAQLPGLINPDNIIFSNHSGTAQQILVISLLLMSMMMLISGLLYAIGYAFRIDKLLRFSKTEIGEVLVTLLIVALFIGTFSVGSMVIGTPNLFALGKGALSQGVFTKDCSLLSEESFSLIPAMLIYGYEDQAINAIGGTKITFMPDGFGVSVVPFAGMTLIRPVMSLLIYLTNLFIFIPLGTVMFIAFIYAFFPLFLYLGILFRTFPVTRAVGGTFLGLFIAFYVVFPILLYSMITTYSPVCGTYGSTACLPGPKIPVLSDIAGAVASFIPTAWISNITALFLAGGIGLVNSFIKVFAEPVIFAAFSVFLSLIISFDFMEALGDLLGAPSLRSSDMLKRVL